MVPALLALLFSVASPTLLGHVTDPYGRPVMHADVHLSSADGSVRNATTDDHGNFRFEIPGRFQLQIEHDGFRSVETTPTSLPGSGLYQIEISMYPGEAVPVDAVTLRILE